MPAQTLASADPVLSSIAVAVPVPRPLAAGTVIARRRVLAMTVLAAGVVASGLAAVGMLAIATRQPVAPAPATELPPAGLTIPGPEGVSVVAQVYEPGQDSGWHAHSGIHAVAIRSGALTVYDTSCGRQSFVPGRPYVGGQELHLARNETDEPVEMVVTYLTPAAQADSTRHASSPACWGEGKS